MAMPVLRSAAAAAAFLLLLSDAADALDDDARTKAKQELQAINGQISILSHAFNLIHEVVAPSVVSIHTRATISQFPWEGRREAEVEVGEGSGFVVAADDTASWILTNAHVVLQTSNEQFVLGVNNQPVGYDSIKVQLNDNRVVDASYVGTDLNTDLAVLKILTPHLAVIDWGDSDLARVGDWVLALGYPFGVGYSATSGIVSATDRSTGVYQSVNGLESFIQTDAAINPGNSGGPLVGLDGKIIGVNASIFNNGGGGNVGIGFAIPANLARRVAEDLIAYGHVRTPGIGIDMDVVGPEQAEGLGLPPVATVRIIRVLPQTPAATGDLEAKDLVLAVNQMPIQSLMSFRARIASCRIGAPMVITVWRAGKTLDRTVIPVDRDQIAPQLRAASETAGQDQDVDLPAYGMHLGTDDAPGLVVTEVIAGGVADQAKLQLGDRLLHERTLKDLRTKDDAAALGTRSEIVVEVLRDGRGFWVRLKR